jgi:hypothetical protein
MFHGTSDNPTGEQLIFSSLRQFAAPLTLWFQSPSVL